MRQRGVHARRLLATLVLTLLPGPAESGQKADRFTQAIDFGCAEAASLPDAVRSYLEDHIRREGRLGAANWLDRTVRPDLNGDGAGEYLVPYDCGETGFCIWALFDGSTLQHLGDLEAAVIYLTPPRKNRWLSVEAFFRSGDAEGWVATYQPRGNSYSRGSWSRLFDPTGAGAIRRYLSTHPAVECAADRTFP